MTAATVPSFEGVLWRPSAALRVAHDPTEKRRLAAIVMAAILAFALTLTAAPHATSLDLSGPETRVAAQTDTAAALVGAGGPETPATVGGNGAHSYDGMLGCCVAPNGIPGVRVPGGVAEQATDAASLAARADVEAGTQIWRVGTTGRSKAADAQFWSPEHPSTPGFADRYGVPTENVLNADYIESAVVPPGTPFVTRPAPGVGTNLGGGIEVVVPEGAVRMCGFSVVGGC